MEFNYYSISNFNLDRKAFDVLAYVAWRSRRTSLIRACDEASFIFKMRVHKVERLVKLLDANSGYFDKDLKESVEKKAKSEKERWQRLQKQVKHIKVPTRTNDSKPSTPSLKPRKRLRT